MAALLLAGLPMGCGPGLYDEITLMPAPTAYAQANIDPFPTLTASNFRAHTDLFYVTDRQPAGPDDPQAFYNNRRGHVLRAGQARVTIDPPLETWDAARRVTLSETRDTAYTLRVAETQAFGVLPVSATRYLDTRPAPAEMQAAARAFARQVDAQLARSEIKDIFIYTHGYNVDFDYATLVSKELQHFLGYQGAFISYNWTATPSRTAYFRDQESVLATRRHLRSLIEYLSETTRVERIHLIGYSAGSRLAFEAGYQIALKPEPRPRMGQLVLISSDLDSAFVLQSMEDGLLDAFESVTFYQSQTDAALAVSRALFGRQRIGQASAPGTLPRGVVAGLSDFDRLHIIDVTAAEASGAGNGHHYFRASPWASSDLFVSLLTGKAPGERGLIRDPGDPIWRFPQDYPARLSTLPSGG